MRGDWFGLPSQERAEGTQEDNFVEFRHILRIEAGRAIHTRAAPYCYELPKVILVCGLPDDCHQAFGGCQGVEENKPALKAHSSAIEISAYTNKEDGIDL